LFGWGHTVAGRLSLDRDDVMLCSDFEGSHSILPTQILAEALQLFDVRVQPANEVRFLVPGILQRPSENPEI